MKWLMIVNDIRHLDTALSTATLAARAAQRGHEMYVASVDAIEVTPSAALVARAARVTEFSDARALIEGLRGAALDRVELEACDLVWIRTNPARDKARAWAHDTFLSIAQMAAERGVCVLNAPSGLEKAQSKLYLMGMPPRFRPRTLITRDIGSIRSFLEEEGRVVLKPLQGTHGTDVFVVDASRGMENLNQIVSVLTRSGSAMVQAFVPEATEGDTRVLMLEGRPLTVGGKVAAVRRIPSGTDFRSNVHAGGRAAAGELTEAIRAVTDGVGPILERDGLFLVGLDIIGGVVIEVNVFSPGGFPDAGAFAGEDFVGAVLDAAERRAAR